MGAVKSTVLSQGVQGLRKRLDPSMCHQHCLPLYSRISALFPPALLPTALWAPVHVPKPGSHQSLTEGLSPGLRLGRLRLEAWAFLESQERTLTTLPRSLIHPETIEVRGGELGKTRTGRITGILLSAVSTQLSSTTCVSLAEFSSELCISALFSSLPGFLLCSFSS